MKLHEWQLWMRNHTQYGTVVVSGLKDVKCDAGEYIGEYLSGLQLQPDGLIRRDRASRRKLESIERDAQKMPDAP